MHADSYSSFPFRILFCPVTAPHLHPNRLRNLSLPLPSATPSPHCFPSKKHLN